MPPPEVLYVETTDEFGQTSAPLAERLKEIAELPKQSISIPRGSKVTRQGVVQTFQDAFEMIGGVTRLAHWADAHETEFYKLYGKLLPATSSVMLDAQVHQVVEHRLPPPRIRSGAVIQGKRMDQRTIEDGGE